MSTGFSTTIKHQSTFDAMRSGLGSLFGKSPKRNEEQHALLTSVQGERGRVHRQATILDQRDAEHEQIWKTFSRDSKSATQALKSKQKALTAGVVVSGLYFAPVAFVTMVGSMFLVKKLSDGAMSKIRPMLESGSLTLKDKQDLETLLEGKQEKNEIIRKLSSTSESLSPAEKELVLNTIDTSESPAALLTLRKGIDAELPIISEARESAIGAIQLALQLVSRAAVSLNPVGMAYVLFKGISEVAKQLQQLGGSDSEVLEAVSEIFGLVGALVITTIGLESLENFIPDRVTQEFEQALHQGASEGTAHFENQIHEAVENHDHLQAAASELHQPAAMAQPQHTAPIQPPITLADLNPSQTTDYLFDGTLPPAHHDQDFGPFVSAGHSSGDELGRHAAAQSYDGGNHDAETLGLPSAPNTGPTTPSHVLTTAKQEDIENLLKATGDISSADKSSILTAFNGYSLTSGQEDWVKSLALDPSTHADSAWTGAEWAKVTATDQSLINELVHIVDPHHLTDFDKSNIKAELTKSGDISATEKSRILAMVQNATLTTADTTFIHSLQSLTGLTATDSAFVDQLVHEVSPSSVLTAHEKAQIESDLRSGTDIQQAGKDAILQELRQANLTAADKTWIRTLPVQTTWDADWANVSTTDKAFINDMMHIADPHTLTQYDKTDLASTLTSSGDISTADQARFSTLLSTAHLTPEDKTFLINLANNSSLTADDKAFIFKEIHRISPSIELTAYEKLQLTAQLVNTTDLTQTEQDALLALVKNSALTDIDRQFFAKLADQTDTSVLTAAQRAVLTTADKDFINELNAIANPPAHAGGSSSEVNYTGAIVGSVVGGLFLILLIVIAAKKCGSEDASSADSDVNEDETAPRTPPSPGSGSRPRNVGLDAVDEEMAARNSANVAPQHGQQHQHERMDHLHDDYIQGDGSETGNTGSAATSARRRYSSQAPGTASTMTVVREDVNDDREAERRHNDMQHHPSAAATLSTHQFHPPRSSVVRVTTPKPASSRFSGTTLRDVNAGDDEREHRSLTEKQRQELAAQQLQQRVSSSVSSSSTTVTMTPRERGLEPQQDRGLANAFKLILQSQLDVHRAQLHLDTQVFGLEQRARDHAHSLAALQADIPYTQGQPRVLMSPEADADERGQQDPAFDREIHQQNLLRLQIATGMADIAHREGEGLSQYRHQAAQYRQGSGTTTPAFPTK